MRASSKITTALLVGALLLLVQGAQWVWAASSQVRVLDSQGLVRNAKIVSHPTTVVIVLAAADAENLPSLTISNVDGVGAELHASRDAHNEYRFNQVGEGSWQIRVNNGKVKVVSVRIE